MNILIVERTIENSPYASFCKIWAQMMPTTKVRNFAKAVPVNDHTSPFPILRDIEDELIRVIISLTVIINYSPFAPPNNNEKLHTTNVTIILRKTTMKTKAIRLGPAGLTGTDAL